MNLRPITVSDCPALVSFFENQRYELCEYSLASILAWRDDDYQPYCGIDQDTLVISAQFNIHPEYRYLLLPISPTREFSPRELQDLALELNQDAFWCVPEEYIRKHGRQEVAAYFDIAEHVGYADYIYRTEDLEQLKGNRYAKKRNLINQFERHYADRDRVRVEPITPAVVNACIDFVEKWCDAYPCDVDADDNLSCEKQALLCAIQHVDVLGLAALLIRVDGEISALGIGTGLTRHMGVLHFEKAFTHIKGLYQYVDRQCARQLFRGYPYVNKENDMGLPGLVKAKKSYHPVKIMKSYKLSVL